MHLNLVGIKAKLERFSFMSRLIARRVLAFGTQTGWFFLQSIAARRLAAVAAVFGELIF